MLRLKLYSETAVKKFFSLFLLTALFSSCGNLKTLNDEITLFQIKSGESVYTVSENLQDEGLIDNAKQFRLFVRLKKADRNIKSGYYEVPPNASYADLIALFSSGVSYSIKVTIPEGYNIFEIAAVMQENDLVSESDFILAAHDPELLARYDLPEDGSLEGYLFPDTYYVPFDADATAIVTMMLDNFDSVVDEEMLAEIEATGYTLNEILTMASIVEKESAVESEKPTIAGVYYHRLSIDMILQADPTLIYALTLAGVYDGDIKWSHFEFDSPYNTYKSSGLPPYPIANPGETSILAAMYPEDVDYLYFCAGPNGGHVFAETYSEHLRNVNAYLR